MEQSAISETQRSFKVNLKSWLRDNSVVLNCVLSVLLYSIAVLFECISYVCCSCHDACLGLQLKIVRHIYRNVIKVQCPCHSKLYE